MHGDPLRRTRFPLRYVDKGDEIIVYDGNDNTAGKINKTTFKTVYSTPSIRLSAGPYTTFLNLGTYYNLDDAKQVLELQEKAEAVPIFAPGRIVGWTNKEHTIKLKDTKGFWSKLWYFFKDLLNFRKALT